MTTEYCRSLAKRMQSYFSRLASDNPGQFREELAVSAKFSDLFTKDPVCPIDLENLAKQLKLLSGRSGAASAILEIELAVDSLRRGVS